MPNNEPLQLKPIDHSKNEIESTIAFLNGTISHPIDEKIWEWEFNTFRDDTVLTILKDQGKTVGTQFMLPVRLNFRDQEILSGKCENSYFHNDYKGKGLFEKLFKTATDDAVGKSMKLLWAFTPATKVYEKKLGFTVFPDSMYTFSSFFGRPGIAYLDSFAASKPKRWLKYVYYLGKSAVVGLKRQSFRAQTNYSKSLKKYAIHNSLTGSDDLIQFYARLRSRNKDLIHINLNPSYMDWRITQNINLSYVTRYFYLNGELAGYYLMAVNRFSANLTDLSFLDPETAGLLIGHLLGEISARKLVEFNYFGNIENEINRHIFGLLQKLGGQLKKAASMPFVFRLDPAMACDPDNSFFALPKNWYLNGLWTEGFQY
jgi:hypothetical protein